MGEDIRLNTRFKAIFMMLLIVSLMFAQFSFAIATEDSESVPEIEAEAKDLSGCYEKEYLDSELLLPGCGPVECGAQGVIYGQVCSCKTGDEKSTCKMESSCSGGSKISCDDVKNVSSNIDILFAEKEKSVVVFFIPDSTEKDQTYMVELPSLEEKEVHNLWFYNKISDGKKGNVLRVYMFGSMVAVYDIRVKWSEDFSKLEFSKSVSSKEYISDAYADYKIEKLLSKDKNNLHYDFYVKDESGSIDHVNGYLAVLTKNTPAETDTGTEPTEPTDNTCIENCNDKLIIGAKFDGGFDVPIQPTYESEPFSDSSNLYPGIIKNAQGDGKYSIVRISDEYMHEEGEGVSGNIVINGKNYEITETDVLAGGYPDIAPPKSSDEKTLQAEVFFGLPSNKIAVDDDTKVRLPAYANIFQIKAWFADSKSDGQIDVSSSNLCLIQDTIPDSKLERVNAYVYVTDSKGNSKMQAIPLTSSDNYCNIKADFSVLERSNFVSVHRLDLQAVYSKISMGEKTYYLIEASDDFRFWSGSQAPPDEQENIKFDSAGNSVYTAKGTEMNELTSSKLFGNNMIMHKEVKDKSDVCVMGGVTCDDPCLKNGGNYYSKKIVGDYCVGSGLMNSGEINPDYVKGDYVCCFDNSDNDKCGSAEMPPCIYGCKDGLSACKSEDGKGICKEACYGGKNVNPVKIDDEGRIGQCENDNDNECKGTNVDINQGVEGEDGGTSVESDYPPLVINSIVLENDASIQEIIVDQNSPSSVVKTLKLRVENFDYEDVLIFADLVPVDDSAGSLPQRILIASEKYGTDDDPSGFGYYDMLAYDVEIPTTIMGDYKLKVTVEQAGSPSREESRFWYGEDVNKGLVRLLSAEQKAKELAEGNNKNKVSSDGTGSEGDSVSYEYEFPSLDEIKFTDSEKIRIEKAMGKFFSEKQKYESKGGNTDSYFNSIIELFALAYTVSGDPMQGIQFTENTKDYTISQKEQFIAQFDEYLTQTVKDFNKKIIIDNLGAAIAAADIILPEGSRSDSASFWGAVKYQVSTYFKSPSKVAYSPWGDPKTGIAIDYGFKVVIDNFAFKMKNVYPSLVINRINELDSSEVDSLAEDKSESVLHYRSALITKENKGPEDAYLYLNNLYYTPAVLRDADNYLNVMYSNFFCPASETIQDWKYYDACQTMYVQRVNNYHVYEQNFYGSTAKLDKHFDYEKAFLNDDRMQLDSAANRMHWLTVGDVLTSLAIGIATGSVIAGVVGKVAKAGLTVKRMVIGTLVAGTVIGIGAEGYNHYICFDNAKMEQGKFKSRYMGSGSDLEATNTVLARCWEETAISVAFFGGGFSVGGKAVAKEISKPDLFSNAFKKIFSKELFKRPRMAEALKGKSKFSGTKEKVFSGKNAEAGSGSGSAGKGSSSSAGPKIPNYGAEFKTHFENLFETARARYNLYKTYSSEKLSPKAISKLKEKLFDTKDINDLKSRIDRSSLDEAKKIELKKYIDSETSRLKTEFETELIARMNGASSSAKASSEGQSATSSSSSKKNFNKAKSTPKPERPGVHYGKGYVQEEVIPEHGGVVQDRVYVNSRGGIVITDGTTRSGPSAAIAAEIAAEGINKGGTNVPGLADKLCDLVELYGNDYGKIYSELDNYAWKTLSPLITKESGATTTAVVAFITKDKRLITYRIGDTEARISRKSGMFGGRKLYHIDQFYMGKEDTPESIHSLFKGQMLDKSSVVFSSGTKFQVYFKNAPNQLGVAGMNSGRLTVHVLKPGDNIVLSSDGISKALSEESIAKIVGDSKLTITEKEARLVQDSLKVGKLDDYGVFMVSVD